MHMDPATISKLQPDPVCGLTAAGTAVPVMAVVAAGAVASATVAGEPIPGWIPALASCASVRFPQLPELICEASDALTTCFCRWPPKSVVTVPVAGLAALATA